MASATTNVIVLTPNGRRQSGKATPNTTILQVLEEACKKQDLKPEEYDLRHHRNVLDTSIPIRFSGLPNNAQVEMIPISKPRCEGDLILGIHLESGERLTGNFKPHNTLMEVINSLCPNAVKLNENPVIIYMRREVYGAALQQTSLRDLGLTSGRAMFRLIHRTPEELKTQANVSAPLPSKPTEEKPYVRKLQKIEEPKPFPIQAAKIKKEQPQSTTFQEPGVKKQYSENLKKENKTSNLVKTIKQEKRKQTEKMPTKTSKKPTVDQEEQIEFIFLGDRNAMLFSYEMAKSIPSEELTDDFFELTLDDAKRLLKDLKKQRIAYENGKLATSAMRELEESKKQLRLLNQYKKAIMRIQFPNYIVLQGTFLPSETIDHVLQFVREYLEDNTLNFYLFTTPPKEILNPSSILIDIGCVPGALVHFGSDVVKENNEYLRKDLQDKLTTLSKASLFSSKLRSSVKSYQSDDEDENDTLIQDDVNIGASTSSGVTYENYTPKQPVVEQKLPKWFKNQ